MHGYPFARAVHHRPMETIGDKVAQLELDLSAMKAASQGVGDASKEFIHVAGGERSAPALNVGLGQSGCRAIDFSSLQLAQSNSHLFDQKLHHLDPAQ